MGWRGFVDVTADLNQVDIENIHNLELEHQHVLENLDVNHE